MRSRDRRHFSFITSCQIPDIEVVAITVVCGNVPVDIGTQNVLKCLERCDRLDIPVYQGMEKPLKQPFISAQDTHGLDGLGDTNFPMVLAKQAESLHAVDFLADYFKEKQIHQSLLWVL